MFKPPGAVVVNKLPSVVRRHAKIELSPDKFQVNSQKSCCKNKIMSFFPCNLDVKVLKQKKQNVVRSVGLRS